MNIITEAVIFLLSKRRKSKISYLKLLGIFSQIELMNYHSHVINVFSLPEEMGILIEVLLIYGHFQLLV